MPRVADPLRIRFVHTRYPHWGGRSGYPQFVRHLDADSFRTGLHGASDNHADLPRALAPLRGRLMRLVRRRNMPWYKLSDLNAEGRAFLACLGRRADIVHFLDGEHAPLFLPRMLRRSRLASARVVATFHQPPGIVGDLVDPDLLPLLDQVVLVSPSQLPFFRRHVAPERLHVILHGVDVDFFHPPAMRRTDGPLRCITVGHWLRDWHVFRDVAAALPEVAFDVVSGRAAALQTLPNVRVHRGLDDAALADLYCEADILFLPLLESTANNGLLEGIASGLPVVATDLEAVRAYLPGEGVLRIPPDAVGPAVAALRRLRDDVALRLEMGKAARARAEELAWPRLAPQYEALYRRAIEIPARSIEGAPAAAL